MIRIYINDQEVDLYTDAEISHNYQVNEFGEVQHRQADYTNRFKIPRSAKNAEILDFLNFTGSGSEYPYTTSTIRVVDGSLEIVTNGKAFISGTKPGYYEIFIIYGSASLFEYMDPFTLQSIDWTSYDHNHNSTDAIASFANTSGYIYALSNQGENLSYLPGGGTAVEIYYTAPSVFLHTVWDELKSFLPYNLESSWLDSLPSDHLWYKMLLPCTWNPINGWNETGVFEMNFNVPAIPMIDFVKAVLQQFGLVIELDRSDKYGNTFRMEPMEWILWRYYGSDDWTSKLAGEEAEKYNKTSFAKRNSFDYQYSEDDGVGELGILDHVEEISVNDKLTLSTELVDSIFTIGQLGSEFDGSPDILLKTLWYARENPGDTPEEKREIPYLATLDTHTTVRNDNEIRGGSTQVIGSGVDIPILVRDGLDWSLDLVPTYYERLFRMNERALLKTVLLDLSILDILDLSFFKLKYFDQYAEYFYLNKIIKWRSGNLCKAEIVSVRNPLAGRETGCGNPVQNPLFEGTITPTWTIASSGAGGQTSSDPCIIDMTSEDNMVIQQTINDDLISGDYLVYFKFEKEIDIQTWSLDMDLGSVTGIAVFTSESGNIQEGSIEVNIPSTQSAPWGINLDFAYSGENNDSVLYHFFICRKPFTPPELD